MLVPITYQIDIVCKTVILIISSKKYLVKNSNANQRYFDIKVIKNNRPKCSNDTLQIVFGNKYKK